MLRGAFSRCALRKPVLKLDDMNPTIERRFLLRSAVATGASLLLPAARACEFFTTNLRIVTPWTRATMVGTPSAVIGMTFDDVAQNDRLIGVETPIAAGAEMVGPGVGPQINFPIPQGQETVLGETGVVIRLVGLNTPMGIGRIYPITLLFEKGGSVTADLRVLYMPYA